MEKNDILNLAKKVKEATYKVSLSKTEEKNKIILKIKEKIEQNQNQILAQNEIDVKNSSSKPKAFIDRLTLNKKRIEEMTKNLEEISLLDDPVGKTIAEWTTTDQLKIKKVKVPIGVIAIIYESRPNVTVEATALCLKSGNCVVLRGGSEALNTNKILVEIIKSALKEVSFPTDAVGFISSPQREIVYELIKLRNYIDLVIARGGEEMIKEIIEKSSIPVLAHGKGLCHTYIDKDANIEMAIKIAYNAKVQRPGVCNAMETLLVHKDVANLVLPELFKLYKSANVEIRGCKEILKMFNGIKPATEEDWSTEYLDLIISIKIVNSLEEAIQHINKYGSGHSEAIVTDNRDAAEKFLKEVDASAVFHNSSTRLHDGGVFGLGSEIGISTQKLHARGTMGLNELTTTKYLVYGKGHIRQ